jgi:hypothetical protein
MKAQASGQKGERHQQYQEINVAWFFEVPDEVNPGETLLRSASGVVSV